MSNNKNYLKYFDLIYDINHGLMNTNDWAYKVVNSDDNRLYIYKNGELYSDDNDNICFEELYKNCDVMNIKLNIVERPKKEEVKPLKDKTGKSKYYSEEDFFSYLDDEEEEDDNEYIDEDDEYDNFYDDTPKEIAHQRALDSIIKMIERKYIDLDMEIDCCQGCMSNLNQAFEELKIYSDIVKFLGGNIEGKRQELVDDWYERARAREEKENKEKAERDAIIEKLSLNIVELAELRYCSKDRLASIITSSLLSMQDKINEICDKIINLEKMSK